MAIPIIRDTIEGMQAKFLKGMQQYSQVQIKNNPELHEYITTFLYYYASDNDFEMVKFILSDSRIPKIDIHENEDQFFLISADQRMNIIDFLIFEYNIIETKNITLFISKNNREDIRQMFDKRNLHENLLLDLEDKKTKKGKKI